MRSSFAVLLLVGAATMARADAGAEPPQRVAMLEWTAPRDCPLAITMIGRIEGRMGASLPETATPVRVIVRGREGTRLVATVWTIGPDGRGLDPRVLTNDRCEPLADAIAVVIARLEREYLAVHEPTAADATAHDDGALDDGALADGALAADDEDPLAGITRTPALPPRTVRAARDSVVATPPVAAGATPVDATTAGFPAPVRRDVPGPTTIRAQPTPRTPADRELSPWGGGVRALAVSGVGAMPGIGVGGELAAFARKREVFGELAATRWMRSERSTSATAGPVDLGLDALAVRAGWVPEHTLIRAWGTAEIGRWTTAQDSMSSGRWLAIGAGAAVAWPISDAVRLVGTFEMMVPVDRSAFMTPRGDEIHRPSAGSARCSLGVEVGWW